MRSRNRGQILVLVAMTISLTILSTQAYIYRLSERRSQPDWDTLCDYILSIEQGTRHIVVSSLINISRGGDSSNLGYNLDRWTEFVGGDYQFGRLDLNVTEASQAPYSDGIWINWSTPGMGISSACIETALNLSGRGAEVDWAFATNITTTLIISGSYAKISGNIKNVTVVLNLLAEGEPALVGTINIRYHKQHSWQDPAVLSSYSQIDFGNGTCRCSFLDEIPESTVDVRAQVYDARQIFVEAEETLLEG